MTEVTRDMHAYLGGRLPDLADLHDDLIADTLGDLYAALGTLYREIGENSGRDHATSEVQTRLKPMAITILNRRVADLFRYRHSRSSVSIDEQQLDARQDPKLGLERSLYLEELLTLITDEFSGWSATDRDLMLLVYRESGARGLKLTAAERKRLSRMRTKLRKMLEEKTGMATTSILSRD